MTDYHPRDLGPRVRAALAEMPVVVITGMRQTGKSTFLQRDPALRPRRYASFDDFASLAAAQAAPEDFVAGEGPLTIDEVQKFPAILTVIKAAVDRKRRPGQFLLSGSANFSMLKSLTETLAGRAVYLSLHPFTRRELRGEIKSKPFLYNFLIDGRLAKDPLPEPVKTPEVLTGGMPSVSLGEVKNGALWFQGFEQTYLERDLRGLSQIGDLISFRKLMRLTALRTGQLLNLSQLGRDAKLNTATTSRYLSLLETSFVVQRLHPYLGNRASRLIKSPKFYLSDSGLACFLAGVKNFRLGEDDALKGAMLETYVAQNLAGLLAAQWPEAELFFWNVQARHEVDFVIEAGGTCLALEVKSGTRWNDRDLAGLRAFLESTPHCQAAILAYNGTQPVKLGKRLWALPLGLILA